MPRYYRRRATRVVRPKKKWATNLREFTLDLPSNTTTGQIGLYKLLCVNKSEVEEGTAVSPTPTIIKTGNYKVQCDVVMSTTEATVVRLYAYILYVPEGVFTPGSVTADYTSLNNIVLRHPEWIIGWRQVSADFLAANANVDKVQFSSRLKRNLNSGDQVYFVLTAKTDTNQISKLSCRGMAQFWTCAN